MNNFQVNGVSLGKSNFKQKQMRFRTITLCRIVIVKSTFSFEFLRGYGSYMMAWICKSIAILKRSSPKDSCIYIVCRTFLLADWLIIRWQVVWSGWLSCSLQSPSCKEGLEVLLKIYQLGKCYLMFFMLSSFVQLNCRWFSIVSMWQSFERIIPGIPRRGSRPCLTSLPKTPQCCADIGVST